MQRTEPQVFLVAATKFRMSGVASYFKSIGSPDWDPTVMTSDGENLVEMAGRMCYRSWEPYNKDKPHATNPNVKKVRKGNKKYIENILNVGHGSILEHVNMTFIAKDVSRIFTHQLVRHRAGMAFSQESLHYLRLDHLRFWLPDEVKGNAKAYSLFTEFIGLMEKIQLELADIFDIENIKNFKLKKELTTVFRRLAPMGLSTQIMFTANIRALRHMIALRSTGNNDTEISKVFDMIAQVCLAEYPNFFQDMTRIDNDRYGWEFKNQKV